MCADHPWVQEHGVANDKPLDSAVLSRMTQFSAMNKLKKMAIRVRSKCINARSKKKKDDLVRISRPLPAGDCREFVRRRARGVERNVQDD